MLAYPPTIIHQKRFDAFHFQEMSQTIEFSQPKRAISRTRLSAVNYKDEQ